MSNDNNELKNNAPCEEKQEAHKLTEEDLEQVTGGLAKTSYETLKIELWDYEGLKDMPPCE